MAGMERTPPRKGEGAYEKCNPIVMNGVPSGTDAFSYSQRLSSEQSSTTLVTFPSLTAIVLCQQ